jgi:hypothetical protein
MSAANKAFHLQGILGAIDTAVPRQKRTFNLGNTTPHTVTEFVTLLESALGMKAVRDYVRLPQLGDVLHTHSNITAAADAFGYAPQVGLVANAAVELHACDRLQRALTCSILCAHFLCIALQECAQAAWLLPNSICYVSLARLCTEQKLVCAQVSLQEGTQRFADWFRSYYGDKGNQLAADEAAYKPL